ncbi:MAG: hypothetical protein BAJATHORv1_10219 [Candidatus Thorarchaeota archaeon]|nr:MAG: hypothetical protein BAJATHORv1_10219 [Candidatus Thorarchaeota archaeon]
MADTFTMKLDEIQPSQLYISQKKLKKIMKLFEKDLTHLIPPIPIKQLDGHMMSTDGHTRSLAWYLNGYTQVECEWEDSDLDWEAYSICIRWCIEEGIHSIINLKERIVPHDQYKIVWLERCQIMQDELAKKRDI